MIRYPRRLESTREIAQLQQVFPIQRIGRSNRHRHAVHRDRIVGAHTFEHLDRAPARDYEIFRDDLEPIDLRPRLEHMPIVLAPEPHAITEHRKVRAFHRFPYAQVLVEITIADRAKLTREINQSDREHFGPMQDFMSAGCYVAEIVIWRTRAAAARIDASDSKTRRCLISTRCTRWRCGWCAMPTTPAICCRRRCCAPTAFFINSRVGPIVARGC